tara:strand:+ start:61 stop:2310 length:2250 start_codon:yes stop_codon:yes gene_type:complete
MGYSAINVPGEAEAFQKVISGDIIYYVRRDGLDTNTGLAASSSGSGVGPFLTVNKAIQVINKSSIAPGATVTIDIGGCLSIDAGDFRSGSILVNHPNADRIVIQGAEPTSIPVNSVRTYGQNSAVTGGYFMEVNLESLPSGMTAGDILVIEEPNYFSNATSPIIYENDFQTTKMAVVDDEQGVKDHAHNVSNNATLGLTFEPFDATARKFLACGAHEVAECRAAGTANYALLFVRHTNPHAGFTQSTEPRNAFVTPQGIKLTSTGDLAYAELAQNYNEHHLLRYSAGTNGITGSSGFTSDGATQEEYLSANRQKAVNLRAKLYKTRLNFDSSDGLNIETNLRELKNVAILGPAHAYSASLGRGATYDLKNLATNRGISIRGSERGSGYGSTMFTNVAVSGFEYGVDIENAGLSADNLYCSSNQVGLRSNQNTFADINHGVFTGNIDGIQSQNGGSVLLERSFSAANERHGARVRGDLVAKASSFCLNGERGVDIERGSFHVVSPSGITGPGEDIMGATQYGGTTSDLSYVTEVERFDKSKRDGAFIFHNYGEGIYGSQADIILNSAVVSYNGKGTTGTNLEARDGSRVKSEFSNFWAPGVTLNLARGNEQSSVYVSGSDGSFTRSQAGQGMNGFAVVRGSRVSVDECFSAGNTYDAYHIVDGSFLRWSGSTAFGSGVAQAGSNGNNTGIRVETASVGVFEGGGISGASQGVSAGHRSNVIESLTFNQVTVEFDNDTNSTVDQNTTGQFT